MLKDVSGVQQRVSAGELKFANDYFIALGGLMQTMVLGDMPPNYNSLVRVFRGQGGRCC